MQKRVCNVVCVPTELPFCMPPLVVGCKKVGGQQNWRERVQNLENLYCNISALLLCVCASFFSSSSDGWMDAPPLMSSPLPCRLQKMLMHPMNEKLVFFFPPQIPWWPFLTWHDTSGRERGEKEECCRIYREIKKKNLSNCNCPTNNALLTNFRLSSDAKFLFISTDWAFKSAPNVQKMYMQRVCIPTELPFCIPPLVVGYASYYVSTVVSRYSELGELCFF